MPRAWTPDAPRAQTSAMIRLAHTPFLLACLALAPAGVNDDGDDPSPQEALLQKAEGRAAKGNYKDAVKYYRQLARKYPNTTEGAIAAFRSMPSAYLGTAPIGEEHGPSANRVDVAIMGDGYQLNEMDQLDDLADDTPPLFKRQATFREYYSYFNFHRVSLVSKDNGVDGFKRQYDTALDGHTIPTIAGHVSVSKEHVDLRLDEMGDNDGLAIIYVKNGNLGTGGGGYATIGGRSPKTVIHEWGHAFGNLGDEYATKTHDRGGVSNRPNVSKTDDLERVPWAHWIEKKVPGVKAYQGASGQVRGAWKPTTNCVMDSGEAFCEPCREALVLRIHAYVDPIESCIPESHDRKNVTPIELVEKAKFEVTVMQPEKHNLEVRWWVLPEADAPRRKISRSADRRARGPLSEIGKKPEDISKSSKPRRTFDLKRKGLDPGRYLVVCRARDTTEIRGERFPWVLKDERDLLVSERSWWVLVPE